jgi:O-antigen/teichoic acid export membrane protein
MLHGDAYLALRSVLGVGRNFVGVLLTQVIGPAAYGFYAIAFGVTVFLCQAARMAADVYLMQQEAASTKEIYHQGLSLLLLSGLGGWTARLAHWLLGCGIPFSWTARDQLEAYWTYVRRCHA